MDWIQVANELESYLRRGDLDYCIKRVTGIMRSLPESPFHHVLSLDFSNDPAEVAAHFDRFASESDQKSQLAAIYTETNGFYINWDRWSFDLFGYSTYGGHDDYDWLSEWDALYETDITLTGMKTLQQIYVDDWENYTRDPNQIDPLEKQLRIATDFCDLMVVLLFQKLIRNSVQFMQYVSVPILATSHDYDFIYEVRPPTIKLI